MTFRALPVSPDAVLPLRTRQREEAGCQIVHDSIHRRDGWTRSFLLELDRAPVGFASVAVDGPWKGRPTVFEFYLLPEHRSEAFTGFEAFAEASGALHFEVQTSDTLLTILLHAYGHGVVTEKIVFRDERTTGLTFAQATLRAVTPAAEIQRAIEARQGGGEWIVEVGGRPAGKGGILFHYNRPYGDVYMEVEKPFRRQGLGAFLVQELKRLAYEFGAVPAARCNATNVASRKTLVRAGFVPSSVILNADLRASAPG